MIIVCIPAYNEEDTISEIVKKSLNYVDKVIVCDDGSDDNTSLKAKQAGALILNHEKNLGKGAALHTLFQQSKKLDADVMVSIDGDGQFLPEEIPKLIEPVLKENYDVVIGYRFNEKEIPNYRKLGNKALNKITNIASDLPFRDTQSGFRAYSKKALKQINFLSRGFGADSEILIDASKKGLSVTEKKVTVKYDTGGKTSTKDPITHSSGVLVSLLEIIAIENPLRYLGIPGIILFILGITYSVVVITIFNDTRYFSVPSTLVSLGSLMLGMMLILVSVVLYAIKKAFLKKNSKTL